VSVGVRAAALQDQTNVVLTVNPLVARSNYLVRVVNVAAGSVTGIVQGVNGQTPLLAPHKLVVMDNVTAWRYHDGGANQGTAWRAPDFDDGSWPSGPAVLGFEDQPLPEPLRTVLRLETGKITYYFRTWFHWPYPNATAWLRLRQIIDDGVVFYMNGVELCRTRMTNQVVAFTNLAERTVTDAACEGPFDFWVTNLVSGANVLAAEVHQAAPTSGDVVFGASLEALVLPSELPWTRLSWGRTAAPGLYQMSWLGAGYRLETAPHFDGPWTLLPPQAPMIYFRPTNTARFHRLSQGP
jgi:hypothetical protein